MLVFGVAEAGSKKQIVGITILPQVLESNLVNKINAKCLPAEMPRFEFIEIEGKNIVIIHCERGEFPPYTTNGDVYLRKGSNNLIATTEEIADLYRRNSTCSDKNVVAAASVQDLDLELALEVLNKRSQAPVTGNDLLDLLFRLGILCSHGEEYKPTIAGMLLFGKKPQDFLPHARIKAEAKINTESIDWDDITECEGNLFDQILHIEAFAKRNIRTSARVVGFERIETPDIPVEAVREAVVNALCHRDYTDTGSEIQFRIHGSEIKVESPGDLISPITLGAILTSKFIPKTRNPIIANMLVSLNYMDKRGTGFTRMIRSIKDAGLEEPIFEEISNGFRVIFNTKKAGVAQGTAIPKHILEKINLTDEDRKILKEIEKRGGLSTTESILILQKSRPYVLDVLGKLEKEGILTTSGKSKFSPNRRYEVNINILEKEKLSPIKAELSPTVSPTQDSLF